VDILTSRRAEPDRFKVRAEADKVRDTNGNRLTDIQVTFQIIFPGDKARAVLPDAVKKSHDRLCTARPHRGDRHTHHHPHRVAAPPGARPAGLPKAIAAPIHRDASAGMTMQRMQAASAFPPGCCRWCPGRRGLVAQAAGLPASRCPG